MPILSKPGPKTGKAFEAASYQQEWAANRHVTANRGRRSDISDKAAPGDRSVYPPWWARGGSFWWFGGGLVADQMLTTLHAFLLSHANNRATGTHITQYSNT